MGQNRQPQYPARIDRSSAYASRVAFAWSAAFPSREQAIGLRANTDNTGKATALPGRVVSSTAGQVNLEWAAQFVTTSTGDGLGDFTVAVYANPAASGSAVEHVFAQKNDAAGSPFAQCALLAHADAGAGFSSGSFSFFTFNGGSSAGAAASGVCDGDYHWWKGIRRGNQHELYKDDVLIATSSSAARGITQSATRYTAIGSRGNGTTESYTRQAVAACAWNRALSIGEVASNPWKLWTATRHGINVPSGAAVNVAGAFAGTLAGAVMAGAGIVDDRGIFASTLAGATMAATGAVGLMPSGAFAGMLDGVAMLAAGQVVDAGIFAAQLAGMNMAASGTVAPQVTGALSSTLGGVTMTASGYVGIPPIATGTTTRRRWRPRFVPQQGA